MSKIEQESNYLYLRHNHPTCIYFFSGNWKRQKKTCFFFFFLLSWSAMNTNEQLLGLGGKWGGMVQECCGFSTSGWKYWKRGGAQEEKKVKNWSKQRIFLTEGRKQPFFWHRIPLFLSILDCFFFRRLPLNTFTPMCAKAWCVPNAEESRVCYVCVCVCRNVFLAHIKEREEKKDIILQMGEEERWGGN